MKMFKTLLSAFAMIAVLSAGAYAQENADVAVTATVQASLDLTPTAINLGAIQQATSTIAANNDDDATEVNLGVGATPGALQIEGTAGVDIVVSWVAAELVNGNSGEEVAFTPSVWNSDTELSSGNTISLTGGDLTLDVGGTLAAPSGTGSYTTATSGTETGTPITFTVQYN